MTESRPTNVKQLDKLIDSWSEDEVDSRALVRRLRRLIGVTVLATMLDSLDEPNGNGPHLALKGGAAIEVRFGVDARATRDVDALVDLDLNEAFERIRERLAAGWEGFTGTLGERTESVRAGIVPAPQRCEIKLKYLNKGFTTLKFELGIAEAGSFSLVEQVPPAVELDRVRLGPVGDVAVLGVHYQIAQKLHACTEPPAMDESNPRVHDIYDILLLRDLATSDGLEHTKAACEDTFRHRAKQTWPPALLEEENWPALWDALDIPNEVRFPYEDARDQLEQFIREIVRS